MNRKQITLSLVLGLALINGIFAHDTKIRNKEKDLDLNSITYIEDEVEIDLGFDPKDYLPEGFDPYKIYVDLNAIPYIENEGVFSLNLEKYLPKDFNPYAYPKNVEGFNYINENDLIELDFDSKQYLPEGFDPFSQ